MHVHSHQKTSLKIHATVPLNNRWHDDQVCQVRIQPYGAALLCRGPHREGGGSEQGPRHHQLPPREGGQG
jgi:hypothetical protein